MERAAPPRRVLHVVHSLERGGTETWLRNVAHHVDPARVRMDFLVHSDAPGAYDEDVRRAGARILVCAGVERPWQYVARLRALLLREGPYDVLHAHVYLFSGFALLAARLAGVPRRLVHAHTAKVEPPSPARRAYRAAMRRLVGGCATEGYAVSAEAGRSFFGPSFGRDRRWQLMYCGIDLAPFRERVDRQAVRAELGVPADARLLAHVGSFSAVKNQRFLLDVLAEARRREPRARLLLVGDGPLRAELERRARALGVREQVVLTGVRADVARLLRAADVFVFPSTYEGLPLAVIEAQASGLRALVSSVVTPEVAVLPEAVTTLSLDAPASRWAEEALELLRRGPAVQDAAGALRHGPFDIETSAAALERAYGARPATG